MALKESEDRKKRTAFSINVANKIVNAGISRGNIIEAASHSSKRPYLQAGEILFGIHQNR